MTPTMSIGHTIESVSLRGCDVQEIVRDVISFAEVHEGTTPRDDAFVSSSEASPHGHLPTLPDPSPEG